MTQKEAILRARALLSDTSPLRGDCGRLCGAACCRADEDGRGGMHLFPGEAALYAQGVPWADIFSDGPLALLVCRGTCPRAERPLACRVFPLVMLAGADGPRVALDRRAWPVCPLMEHGERGLSPAFVRAVRAAADILYADAECRAFMEDTARRIARLSEGIAP